MFSIFCDQFCLIAEMYFLLIALHFSGRGCIEGRYIRMMVQLAGWMDGWMGEGMGRFHVALLDDVAIDVISSF